MLGFGFYKIFEGMFGPAIKCHTLISRVNNLIKIIEALKSVPDSLSKALSDSEFFSLGMVA